jgi:4-hydroxybenzoyl-CoA thioesterase
VVDGFHGGVSGVFRDFTPQPIKCGFSENSTPTMPRIKIELPDNFTFSTDIPIYINHINYGNHLDNSALLALVSEARVRFFKSLGYSELNVEGVGVIVADAAVQYKSEAFHGEVMVLALAANDFNKYGCDLVWQITDQASGREVARGKHGIMFFDYTARKAAPVPPGFIAKVGAAL